MPRRLEKLFLALAVLLPALVLAALAYPAQASEGTRQVHLDARQFAYSPEVVRVPAGATVHLELTSGDVTHGLYLEGYDLSARAIPGKPATLEFVASRPGRYRFYCNTVCGQLHPFMVGELVVEPNWTLFLALGLVPLAAVSGLALGTRRPAFRQVELTRWRPLRWALASRALQQGVIALLLAGLTLAVLAGFFGSPVGSHNFAVIFVWIVWWGLLKLAFIPLGGRAWCAVCPLPAPGEWLQRRAVASRGPARPLGLALEWPRRLRSGWLAIGLLLAIGVASGPILTRPSLTAALLLTLAALAFALSLVYRGRAFCRYVCPVGSFVGLYSLASPVSLRVKDADVCLHHSAKECLRGSATAYGCPWYAYPGSLSRNVECGLCFECLRACPKDNVALYARAPGADFVPADSTRGFADWPRLDEGFGAVVMLALSAIYSAIFLGPWAALKHEALLQTLDQAARHAVLVIGGAGVVAPLAWLVVALAARHAAGGGVPTLRVWGATAYALVPLGLASWVAFTVTFVLGSGSYVAGAVADPLGLGWNLLGLAIPWRPLALSARLWLPIALWLGGLAWSIAVGGRTVRRLYADPLAASRATAVVGLGLALCTGGLVWLGLG